MAHTREHMLGLTTRPERYLRLTRIPFRGIHARLVADVMAANLAPGSRLLDIGTGPGTLPIEIARAVPRVAIDGIDLSAWMITHAIAAARESGCADRITFHTADAGRMPYDDDSFDLIVSSMSQHHWSDAAAVVAEIRRILRPGGRAWIYDGRYTLRRAYSAAQVQFPDGAVRLMPVPTGWLPLRLFARLAIDPRPGPALTTSLPPLAAQEAP
jgi:ubiquinone/menaquinone biosynthesis C-methylase UbiE